MIDETVLFDGWTGIVRIVLVGSLAYVGLVAILRASGKRTLSKMSAFDLVVTVCGHADENSPAIFSQARVVHVGFDYPPKLAKEAAKHAPRQISVIA